MLCPNFEIFIRFIRILSIFCRFWVFFSLVWLGFRFNNPCLRSKNLSVKLMEGISLGTSAVWEKWVD